MTGPELMKNYGTVQGEWIEADTFSEHPIPTEVVVLEPRIVTPRMGRVFRTPFFLFEGEVLHEHEIRALCFEGFEQVEQGDMSWSEYMDACEAQRPEREERWKREMTRVPVYCTERWSDVGSDGHVEYALFGYLFFTEDLLPQITWADGDDWKRLRHPSGLMFGDGNFYPGE